MGEGCSAPVKRPFLAHLKVLDFYIWLQNISSFSSLLSKPNKLCRHRKETLTLPLYGLWLQEKSTWPSQPLDFNSGKADLKVRLVRPACDGLSLRGGWILEKAHVFLLLAAPRTGPWKTHLQGGEWSGPMFDKACAWLDTSPGWGQQRFLNFEWLQPHLDPKLPFLPSPALPLKARKQKSISRRDFEKNLQSCCLNITLHKYFVTLH